MPYDKVVDSAKLDLAMKATADGIRETTNYDGELQWDEERGFYTPIIGLVDGAVENARQDGYSEGFSRGNEAGYNQGYTEGEYVGISKGEKAEYDAFWDTYQNNGKRVDYSYAFAGQGWVNDNFRPKYDIIPTAASHLFSAGRITDLSELIEKTGVRFGTSKVTSVSYFAQYSSLTKIPTLDFSSCADLSYLFIYNYNLREIEKVILKSDGSQKFTNYSFGFNESLEEIRFDGTIGQNGLNFQWSTKLSHDSILSIVNALSTTTSGKSVTLSKSAVNKAFETSVGANDGSTSAEWLALVGTRSNWTISLA
jgi:hypothetical protein